MGDERGIGTYLHPIKEVHPYLHPTQEGNDDMKLFIESISILWQGTHPLYIFYVQLKVEIKTIKNIIFASI